MAGKIFTDIILQNKILTGADTPTVPSGEDISLWINTDIAKAEIVVNIDSDRIWTRSDSGIIELAKISDLPANTDSVPEGASNLYFTNERVDDRVAALVSDSSTINVTYNDPGNAFTIEVIDNTSIQKSIVQKNAVDISTRSRLNFIEQTFCTYTITDNPGNDRVDITIQPVSIYNEDGQSTDPVRTLQSFDNSSGSSINIWNGLDYMFRARGDNKILIRGNTFDASSDVQVGDLTDGISTMFTYITGSHTYRFYDVDNMAVRMELVSGAFSVYGVADPVRYVRAANGILSINHPAQCFSVTNKTTGQQTLEGDARGSFNVARSTDGVIKVQLTANPGIWPNNFFIEQTSFGSALQTDASCLVEMISTTLGFGPPEMTTAQRLLIPTTTRMILVMDTDLNRPAFWDGGAWQIL